MFSALFFCVYLLLNFTLPCAIIYSQVANATYFYSLYVLNTNKRNFIRRSGKMTNRFSTKQSLIASILILCLCFTSLIGTTFAWFTDEVTSSANVIKSGTLNVEFYYANR